MANKIFPWTPEQDSVPIAETSHAPKQSTEIRELLKKFLPFMVFVLALVILFATRASSEKSSGDSLNSSPIEVLAPLFAIGKGQQIPLEALQQIPLDRRDVTRGQILQLVKASSLENLRGKLRAKRDLIPNKPLVWGDLQFVQDTAPPAPQTHIIYSKEN